MFMWNGAYLACMVEGAASHDRPAREELLERVRARPPVVADESAEHVVRAERGQLRPVDLIE